MYQKENQTRFTQADRLFFWDLIPISIHTNDFYMVVDCDFIIKHNQQFAEAMDFRIIELPKYPDITQHQLLDYYVEEGKLFYKVLEEAFPVLNHYKIFYPQNLDIESLKNHGVLSKKDKGSTPRPFLFPGVSNGLKNPINRHR